ncbi:phage head-tail joining protein [Halodurantibacterium flavum]|uniref:Phage head-tail joining protein n=1 Tax=Halodurantibacterium flavum TaxID=1382802 RepID=A0ABW4S9L6_9RHOB
MTDDAQLLQMKARLAALQDIRWRGVRSASINGERVDYATDADLAAAVADLERRIAGMEGRPRRRARGTYAVKDL